MQNENTTAPEITDTRTLSLSEKAAYVAEHGSEAYLANLTKAKALVRCKMTRAEKAAYVAKYGQAQYLALPYSE
jgi:hypothetical protein